MIRAFIFLLLFAVPAAAQPSSWRTDVPCTTGRNPALVVADTAVPAQATGCVRAHCIALRDGRRVCACTGDTAVTVRLEENGRVVHEWDADYSLASAAESLGALQGDLDGDGRAETVVREWTDMSNGLGIRYYRLSVFDGRDPARAPVRVGVHDFEPGGSFVRPAGGGDCRLIATRWTELDDPRRGQGMYLVGQWMRYRDGRLEHDPDRPVVARRLLNSFADTRFRTPNSPFAHLRHRDAEVRRDNGIPLPARLVRTDEGSIRRVRGVFGDSLTLYLEPNIVASHSLGDFYRQEDGWLFVTWLVDGATGRPYPPGYQPSDRRWLQDVPTRLMTYRAEDRTVFVIIVRPRPLPSSATGGEHGG